MDTNKTIGERIVEGRKRLGLTSFMLVSVKPVPFAYFFE